MIYGVLSMIHLINFILFITYTFYMSDLYYEYVE